MRRRVHQQLALLPAPLHHEHAAELREISRILDQQTDILEMVLADLLRGASPTEGRAGMSAEQVVRALVVKLMNGYSYEELAFHLVDSTTYRTFCRYGLTDEPPKASALQDNIKRLRPETLEAINRRLIGAARLEKIENGQKVRGDCTVVETNIRSPRDSLLLLDGIETLDRLLEKASQEIAVPWSKHSRRAKRRTNAISRSRAESQRVEAYRDLLKVAEKTVGYAEKAVAQLDTWWTTDKGLERYFQMAQVRSDLLHFVRLTRRVMDQTRRRVLQGEKVPAAQKVLSLFEPHTDLVIKGNRGPEYGHKVFLTTGPSGLVLDCKILTGNPADSTLVKGFLDRHQEIYGAVPRQVAFDGGFASSDNLMLLKQAGVQDVAFHQKRGISVTQMVRSSWVYKRLRNFRAGIEGNISLLKRCFGLARCLWRGFESFLSYVWSSVVTANLLVLARHRLNT